MPPLRPARSISVTALLVGLMGLSLTVGLFAGMRKMEQQRFDSDFQQRALARIVSVQRGLDDAVQVVRILNQFFKTFDTIGREQFHDFTQPLLQHYSYIRAFSFHRMLDGSDRTAYEASLQNAFPGFAVTELIDGKLGLARVKDRYAVVDYIEPLKNNEAAFGLDVSSNRPLAEAMRTAADTGRPTVSRLAQLAQGNGTWRGFLVMMPVYRPGADLGTLAARRAAWIGDTSALFIANELIAKILAAESLLSDDRMRTSVYMASSADEAYLAFRHPETMPTAPAENVFKQVFGDRPASIDRFFGIGGQSWYMRVVLTPKWSSTNHSGSLGVLLGGILFSFGACAYLQTLIVRSQRIQSQVNERTAELSNVNQQLLTDIAARKRTEQALQLRERAIEASTNAIIITSATAPDFPVEYVNSAFERITGHAIADVLGKPLYLLNSHEADQPGLAELQAAMHDKHEAHGMLRNYRQDGSLFWSDLYIAPVKDDAGAVNHFVIAQYDITENKRYEAELEFQSNRDALTGLANRNLLFDRLSQAIAYASRYEHPIWLLYVDLDQFKFINDTLGHRAGDLLLREVAERLLGAVRETDTVARLGGDEFVLILPERTDVALSTTAVQRIMNEVARPMAIGQHEFFLTSSIGVAVYPTDGAEPEVLLKHADIAMYRAKENGRNNFQFYTSTMNERALERLRLEGALRNAVERNEFVLHYQPQVDLRSGQVVGMEALLRWQHPELGMVPPGRFIGLAEETGLIVPIGAWVIQTACQQNKAWQDAGLGQLRISVNLSARQFAQQDLVASIATVLQQTGLAPAYFEIELTESLMMTDVERAIATLDDLHQLGVQLSIDDFGTGYSSLSYLKRFPIDILKIDQSFVRDISIDPDDASIVASIISLAHSLRLGVIAEGVETAEQLAFLREHDCDQVQGYFFSRPIPAAAFEQLLRDGVGLQLPATPYI